MADELIVDRTVRKSTTHTADQKMDDSDGLEDVLTTGAFFKATTLDDWGGVVCVSVDQDLDSLLPPNKIEKNSSNENDEVFLFYNIEEMYDQMAEALSELPIGDINYVSNLGSKKISPKHQLFVSACCSLKSKIILDTAGMYDKASKLASPIHPLFNFMLYGSVITVAQIHDALKMASEMTDLGPLETLFIDMLRKWFSHVLTHEETSDRPRFFLKRSASYPVESTAGVSGAKDLGPGTRYIGEGGKAHGPVAGPTLGYLKGSAGGGGGGGGGEEMDVELEMDGDVYKIDPIADRLEMLRVSLGRIEVEARHVLTACILTAQKIGLLQNLCKAALPLHTSSIMLGSIPIDIERQHLAEIVIDFAAEHDLPINMHDFGEKLADSSGAFYTDREGANGKFCNMILKLLHPQTFCDSGNAALNMRPISGFAHGRLVKAREEEGRAHESAAAHHLRLPYMAVPDRRAAEGVDFKTVAVVRGLRQSVLFFQDSVACARKDIEDRLAPLLAERATSSEHEVFVEVGGQFRALDVTARKKGGG